MQYIHNIQTPAIVRYVASTPKKPLTPTQVYKGWQKCWMGSPSNYVIVTPSKDLRNPLKAVHFNPDSSQTVLICYPTKGSTWNLLEIKPSSYSSVSNH